MSFVPLVIKFQNSYLKERYFSWYNKRFAFPIVDKINIFFQQN